MKMKTKDFDYFLPKELIAQDPLEDRSGSRLLKLDRRTGEIEHGTFRDVLNYLRPGDCLVLNDTKVIPARLLGEREGGGAKVEILLLRRKEGDVWEALARPGKKARPGDRISFGGGRLVAEVVGIAEEGIREVRLCHDGTLEEILGELGQMPLPPYITHPLKDKDRYQTVYARVEGSAAAPTAGLHFTEGLLDEVRAMGVTVASVTLHVGLGTFRPVKEENVSDHHMHTEFYRIMEEEAAKINGARRGGGRILCVGTTSCRTLEAAADESGMVRAGSGETDIFIYPGYEFRATDGLITNFHLPESTLLMLVCALAGRERVLAAYEEAVRERYRFFSFGDAMLII